MARRRVDKAHRHYAISFIAAGPPRIQAVAGPEMTRRRKRLQTGADGNDSDGEDYYCW